jgi:hypothetical protein
MFVKNSGEGLLMTTTQHDELAIWDMSSLMDRSEDSTGPLREAVGTAENVKGLQEPSMAFPSLPLIFTQNRCLSISIELGLIAHSGHNR